MSLRCMLQNESREHSWNQIIYFTNILLLLQIFTHKLTFVILLKKYSVRIYGSGLIRSDKIDTVTPHTMLALPSLQALPLQAGGGGGGLDSTVRGEWWKNFITNKTHCSQTWHGYSDNLSSGGWSEVSPYSTLASKESNCIFSWFYCMIITYNMYKVE